VERIELCDSLGDGGTTPSFGMIAEAVEACFHSKTLLLKLIKIKHHTLTVHMYCKQITAGTGTKLHILIRPRGGNFCYSHRELIVIARDVQVLLFIL
jgi:copper homeostasis protein CutC